MNKERLLEEICNKLSTSNIWCLNNDRITAVKAHVFTPSYPGIRELIWLPEDNLQRMADAPYNSMSTFKEVYKHWEETQCFQFKPYITSVRRGSIPDLPVMVLRHDRFLSVGLGGAFTISRLPDGKDVVVRPSNIPRYFLKDNFSGKCDLHSGFLNFILLYAGLIDVGFQYDNFIWDFYDSDKTFYDDFFHESMYRIGLEFPYVFADIDKCISSEDGSILDNGCSARIYQIELDGDCVCRFALSNNQIQVEYGSTYTAASTISTLKLPRPSTGFTAPNGAALDKDTKLEIDEALKDVTADEKQLVNSLLLLMMMLKFVGIHVDATGVRAIREIGNIKPAYPDSHVSTIVSSRNIDRF